MSKLDCKPKCFMKLILPVVALFVLSSCAEHQYLTISGTNIEKTDTHDFLSKNDTVTVLYHFKPEQGKVVVALFNETDQPLVIDWWKSAIMVGDQVFSYYKPDATISGQVNSTGSRSAGVVTSSGNVNGTIYMNESSQFIPAHAQIGKEMVVFHLDTLKNLPENLATKDTLQGAYNAFIRYRRMSFDKPGAPLSFRSYLTFRIGKAGEEKEFSREHEFYVSEVWKIKASPKDMPPSITSRGDMIYLAP